MLNCKEVTYLVSEHQDRKPSLKESLHLKLHLMMCAGCRNMEQHVKFLRQATTRYAIEVNKDDHG